jgi:hypothetical protein
MAEMGIRKESVGNKPGLGNNRGLVMVQTLSDWVLSPETTSQNRFTQK